jgi:hypothetical protein
MTAGAAAEVVKSMVAHERRLQTGKNPLVTLPGMDCSTSPYADTYYGCALFKENYITSYTRRENGGPDIPPANYSSRLLPVMDQNTPLDVKFGVTFIDLVNVDEANNAVTVSFLIEMQWYDQILTWDNSKTPTNAEDKFKYVQIPEGTIYTPDISVWNSISPNNAYDLVGLYLYPSGLGYFSAKQTVTFPCSMSFNKFPKDTQSCDLQFSSFIYSAARLKIGSLFTTAYEDTWNQNLQYDVTAVTTSLENMANPAAEQASASSIVFPSGEYNYDFAIYTFNIERYYKPYAIYAGPSILLIIFGWLAMVFMAPYDNSRILFQFGNLIALVGIEVAASAGLNTPNSFNWLVETLIINTFFCAVLIMESAIALYMSKQSSSTNNFMVSMLSGVSRMIVGGASATTMASKEGGSSGEVNLMWLDGARGLDLLMVVIFAASYAGTIGGLYNQ